MATEVTDTETNKVGSETNQVGSRNGNVNTDDSAPAANNDVSRLEAGNEPEVEDSAVLTVPDGGWGWMVVLGSFMIHVIADGIAYSFGVFVEDFVDYFECSKSAVGGLGSLMLGVTWGSGTVDLCFILLLTFNCHFQLHATAALVLPGTFHRMWAIERWYNFPLI